MNAGAMIAAYKREIRAKGGIVPQVEGRSTAMKIAKLQDVHRKLNRANSP